VFFKKLTKYDVIIEKLRFLFLKRN